MAEDYPKSTVRIGPAFPALLKELEAIPEQHHAERIRVLAEFGAIIGNADPGSILALLRSGPPDSPGRTDGSPHEADGASEEKDPGTSSLIRGLGDEIL